MDPSRGLRVEGPSTYYPDGPRPHGPVRHDVTDNDHDRFLNGPELQNNTLPWPQVKALQNDHLYQARVLRDPLPQHYCPYCVHQIYHDTPSGTRLRANLESWCHDCGWIVLPVHHIWDWDPENEQFTAIRFEDYLWNFMIGRNLGESLETLAREGIPEEVVQQEMARLQREGISVEEYMRETELLYQKIRDEHERW